MILPHSALYTDFYELTMAQGYFLSHKEHERAVFDYFFRKLPFNGGYVLFAGLADFLEFLQNFRFRNEEIDYLESKGFEKKFLNYLRHFRFTGDIHSVKEGEVIFPNEPVLQVEGNIIEAQIIETLLLNIINFESLVATKASRVRCVAPDKLLYDFGLRRAQGLGGMQASKACIIGGFDGTSNVLTGMMNNVEISGTMAHSWIQSFESELEAFRTYASFYPDSSTFLVDTYDTLKSGIPNTIIVAKEMEQKGQKLKAIRLDSGDFAYFSKRTRALLDNAGLNYVKIAVSNQLDEYLIKSLISQHSPIDIFGVGTKLVTSHDSPALDGVYKLSAIEGRATLKISENVEKVTLPGCKTITRFLNADESFNCDGISLCDDTSYKFIQHPYYPAKRTQLNGFKPERIIHPVVLKGEIIADIPTVTESAEYAKQRLSQLNAEHKRFDNPHVFKVGISSKLRRLRDKLMLKNGF